MKPRDGLTVPDLARCRVGLERLYPNEKNATLGQGQIEFGAKVSASATSKHIGFVWSNPSKNQIYQARLDGFTFSRLTPYEGWRSFCDEASRLWGHYRRETDLQQIERIAIRFINRLDIPGERVELKDYLRTSPEISSELPQSLAGFFMRLIIPKDDLKCTTVITEAIVEAPFPEHISLLLDIDLFRTDDPPQEEGEITSFLESMRGVKNTIFEACITDRTRELLK